MFNPHYGCAVHEHVSGHHSVAPVRRDNFIEAQRRAEAKKRLEKRLKEKRNKLAVRRQVNSQDGQTLESEGGQKTSVLCRGISQSAEREKDAEILRRRNCDVPFEFTKWVKRVPGATNRFFSRRPLSINRKTMSLVSNPNYFAVHQYDSTGFRVWDMAVVLARYLAVNKGFRTNMKNKRMIEIGCGMGVVSLAVALLEGGAEIIATDADTAALQSVVVNKNLLLQSASMRDSFKTSKLLFFNMEHIKHIRQDQPFDVVFATDVFYQYSIRLMRNIARTIVALAADPEHEDDRESIKTGNRIIAYLGYQERKCCEYQVFLEFLKELGRHGLYHQYLTLPEPYDDTKNVRGHLIAVLKPSGLKLGLKKEYDDSDIDDED